MKAHATVLLAACLGTLGCAQLRVDRQPADFIEGIPYSLPRKTFVLRVEYRLKECVPARGDAPAVVDIDRTTQLDAVLEPDPAERYYVPYDSLRNAFKATDFTLESFENQTLKGVTATIDDKSASVISSVVSTAITLAPLLAPVATAAPPGEVPLVPPAPPPAANPCKPEAVAALETLRHLRKEAARRVKAPADTDRPAEEIEAETTRVNALLTHRYSLSWTPVRGALSATIEPKEAIKEWLLPASPVPDRLSTTIEFVSADPLPPAATPVKLPLDGLLLRMPVSGVVRICKGACPGGNDASDIIDTKPHVIPQLGPYVVMPLRNRIFESNTMTLVIGETGVITKLGYKTSAIAETAASTLNTNAAAIQKALADREKARADARSAAEKANKDHADRVTEDNKAIADCLDAQRKLREAGGTPVGTCQP
jgi:hypothetical protein